MRSATTDPSNRSLAAPGRRDGQDYLRIGLMRFCGDGIRFVDKRYVLGGRVATPVALPRAPAWQRPPLGNRVTTGAGEQESCGREAVGVQESRKLRARG